jgi:hypothetical protein
MFPAYNKLKAELERARYAARSKRHITPYISSLLHLLTSLSILS